MSRQKVLVSKKYTVSYQNQRQKKFLKMTRYKNDIFDTINICSRANLSKENYEFISLLVSPGTYHVNYNSMQRAKFLVQHVSSIHDNCKKQTNLL